MKACIDGPEWPVDEARHVWLCLALRRRAGGTDKRKVERKQNGFSRRFLESNQVAEGRFRNIEVERTGRMMLNPLAEVGIGMLVPVRIGRRQFVVDILRDGKRRQREKQQDEAERTPGPQPFADET